MGSSQTRGRGRARGVLFFPPICFDSIFVIILSVIVSNMYFRMTAICPSFMVEIIKKIKEPTKCMKAPKGHLSFLNSKSDFVFLCFQIAVAFGEHLTLSYLFQKPEFVFLFFEIKRLWS